MGKKTLLVTGASGNVGRATLKELGKYADFLDVRAGTRDPLKKAALKDLAPNITVVSAASQSLKDAMREVDYLFVIPPTCEERGDIVAEIIKTAKTAGVPLLLLLSVEIAHGTVFGKQFAKMVAAAEESAIPTIILNVTAFMDNLLHCSTVNEIKEHSRITEAMDGGAAHCEICVADIGAVAAKILSDPTPHVGTTYRINAPLFCRNDVASALSAVLGRTIAYEQLPLETWRTKFGEVCPKWLVDGLSDIFKLINDRSPIMTPPDGPANVQKILGRPATSIEEFLKNNAQSFS